MQVVQFAIQMAARLCEWRIPYTSCCKFIPSWAKSS